MKATFENSVNVLLKAYLNDTLEHNNCSACAVGNLIADKMNISFYKKSWFSNKRPQWQYVFCTSLSSKAQEIAPVFYKSESKHQIDATGYQWQDLAKIEYAFETADQGKSDDDWMFNGLMAVIDVLAVIHDVDLSVKEESKLLFVKI